MFKKSHLAVVVLGALAPSSSYAANYCIAVGGGFGSGGETFVGYRLCCSCRGHLLAVVRFTKGFSSVVLLTHGSGCLSSDGKVLSVQPVQRRPVLLRRGRRGERRNPDVPGRHEELPDRRRR